MEGHELVQVSDSPFASLPLFLPENAEYDPETNTVTKKEGHDHHEDNDDPASHRDHHLVKVPGAGWDMLEALDAPISMISCLGPYRTGKSYLASRFMNASNVFRIGPTLEGCTVGIWIGTTALKDVQTGCYKFLLDVEGLGDPLAGDDASNTRMALACLLLSGVVLFNNTSHPDRSSLQFLRCLATIRQRIPDAKDRLGFPSFVWIFRDFFLQLPKRKDTGQPYTLEEYMLERVLPCNTSNNNTHSMAHGDKVETEVVDSLLHDFATLKVLKVGHPKRKGQHPLSPEEMAHLEDLDWNDLDESFRNDIQNVIKTTLSLTKPFQLGHGEEEATSSSSPQKPRKKWGGIFGGRPKPTYARGKAYAKWCDTVLELVNTSGLIPNLPNLQQQLVQQIADKELANSVLAFETEMENYWNACPVYNYNNNGGTVKDDVGNDLVTRHNLHGVAEEAELHDQAQSIFERLKQDLLSNGAIPSTVILEATLNALECRCLDDSDRPTNTATGKNLVAKDFPTSYGSILSRVCAENVRRSQAACAALMNSMYQPVQESIRADPTSLPLRDFETVVGQIRNSFNLQARGPAKGDVLTTLLLQPSQADALFIAKVTEKNEALLDSLAVQESLSKDIEEKEAQLTNLNENLEQVRMQTKLEMEALEKAHENALKKALEENRKREEEERKKLEEQMEHNLRKAQEEAERERLQSEARLKSLEKEAQQRLKAEVEAREQRLKQEKELFEKQINTLKITADTELKEKLELVQSDSRKEQERIEKEMTQRLEESESHLQEEIRIREDQLAQAKKDLEETKKTETELKERLERRICPSFCVVM